MPPPRDMTTGAAVTAAAAAANKQVAGAAARPANDATFAQFRTLLLGLPSQERTGYLDKSFASAPDVPDLLHKFVDLLAEPVAEPVAELVADTANTAAREAAEAQYTTPALSFSLSALSTSGGPLLFVTCFLIRSCQ